VQSAGGLSQHPVDQLIRELIAAARPATPAEAQHILDHLATAPFDAAALGSRRLTNEERAWST
jgi:hypothetical protein